MHSEKKPSAAQKAKDTAVKDATCFSVLAKHDVDCQRKNCPNWIPYEDGNNCVMIAAGNGPHTLQEIGKIYGLTRMRICQIEKGIHEKIRNSCA